MGIPGFFKWLTNKDNYPNIKRFCIEDEPSYDEHGVYQPLDETKKNPNNIEFDNLYLDMNEIIYSAVRSNNGSEIKTEDEIILLIFNYIDRIFSIVRPRKLLYIAMDGVAPRAKLHNQRTKRFLQVKDTIEKTKQIERIKREIIANGGLLPKDNHQKEQIKLFDENCITPGTPFMSKLSDCLLYYIYNRMNRNLAWQSIIVIFSNANEPGEGEHKIINFIRQQLTQLDYNKNIHHVLYGTDADLIILGLTLDECHLTIIRNEFKPSQPRPCEICQQFGHDIITCKGITTKEKYDQQLNSIKTKYIFVDLSLLRDELYQSLEIDKQLLFKWDHKRFLNDWIFICILVGNDFLPNLSSCEIHEDIIKLLINIYKENVLKSNYYLTENGILNLTNVEIFLKDFSKMEEKIFKNRHEINQQKEQQQNLNQSIYNRIFSIDKFKHELVPKGAPLPPFKPKWAQKNSPTFDNNSTSIVIHANRTQDINSSTTSSSISILTNQSSSEMKQKLSDLSLITNRQIEDNTSDNDVRLWEDDWHKQYYTKKFGVDPKDIEKFSLQIAQEYAQGLRWIFQYYFQGVPSWDWYYPYHYAPFVSDLFKIKILSYSFNKDSKPFKPLEQLISIIPSQCSKEYLPNEWYSLTIKKDSQIIDYYPLNFNTDLNGKRFESQRIALIPFIDEKRLHRVLKNYYSLLTIEEQKRNKFENSRLFIHSKHSYYNRLKKEFDTNNGQKIIHKDLFNITKTIEIFGYIWRDSNDDKIISISKTVKHPISSYDNITNNQVMCVQYCY
ncbi:unnamed protein product [Rotaria sordida]|uniref:5'-3' exoribonuclease n=1 Tax=Rotaria sordida TaxID=392033 RepID=A0A815DQ33_9BILA|nr:unnamed protein product [Rotaria sordida]